MQHEMNTQTTPDLDAIVRQARAMQSEVIAQLFARAISAVGTAWTRVRRLVAFELGFDSKSGAGHQHRA